MFQNPHCASLPHVSRHLMITRFLIILATAFCFLAFNKQTDNKKRIDKILNSKMFYLTRIQYGGYMAVRDSVAFDLQNDTIKVCVMHLNPSRLTAGMTKTTLDKKTFEEIRSLLTSDRTSTKKCEPDYLELFNSEDNIKITDSRCDKRLFDAISKKIEKY